MHFVCWESLNTESVQLWRIISILLLHIYNPVVFLISDGFDLTKGKTYLYGSPTTISSALIPFYQASWPSINGITCFNRHGCQQGDETSSRHGRTVQYAYLQAWGMQPLLFQREGADTVVKEVVTSNYMYGPHGVVCVSLIVSCASLILRLNS